MLCYVGVEQWMCILILFTTPDDTVSFIYVEVARLKYVAEADVES